MNERSTKSSAQLLKTTVIAAGVAALILVTVVLPAEYGVDPLHTGRLLGLGALSAAKDDAGAPTESPVESSPQSSIAPAPAATLMHAHPQKYRSARVEIEVKGREELEYKALLATGEPLLYSWTVAGGEVYFEFHGEPTEGNWPKDFYRSYEIVESAAAAHGSFVAPFTGNHGWYWRNLSDQPVTIVLETSGYYSKLGRISAGRIE